LYGNEFEEPKDLDLQWIKEIIQCNQFKGQEELVEGLWNEECISPMEGYDYSMEDTEWQK
jgi:hypothetical protein